MTHRCFCWACILTALLLMGLLVSSNANAQSVPFVSKTLSNGLDVIVVENHMVPLVTIELVAKNGSFTEPAEYNGLSHLYEHMFFKANQKLPSQEQFMNGLEDLGGSLGVSNATTNQEHVNYFIVIPSRNMSGGMDFMSNAIRTPLFDSNELRKETHVVLGEFDRNEASPDFKLRYAMDSAVWSPELFSRKQQLGLRPAILAATPEMMHTIQHRFNIPNNMAIVIAGDVKPEEVYKEAEKYFGAKIWPAGPAPFPKYDPPAFPPITKQLVVREGAEMPYTEITMTWQGPSLGKDNADSYAADVFHTIIGERNSKFKKIWSISGWRIRSIQGGSRKRMSARSRSMLSFPSLRRRKPLRRFRMKLLTGRIPIISPMKSLPPPSALWKATASMKPLPLPNLRQVPYRSGGLLPVSTIISIISRMQRK